MTASQIAECFDVTWANRVTDAHLCCPEANHATKPASSVAAAVPVTTTPYAERQAERVRQALPGTMAELTAKSGESRWTVYAELRRLRALGQIQKVRQRFGQPIIWVYGVVGGRSTSGASE